jgi:hypothetical protein
MRRLTGRVGVIVGAAAAVVAAMAGPASAHVAVSADKPQAGATDVTVTFSAEAESRSAGIVSLRVVLPAGIAPGEVSYVSGPAGWALTAAADGYTIAGPALPVGEDAKYAVKIAKLPADATSLSFKTLQTYSDGRIDRWIEIPSPGAAEPDNPAPTLTLQPAAPASASPSASPSAVATQPAPAVLASTAAAEPAKDSGASTALWWIAAAVVLVVAAAAGLWWRRRQARGSGVGTA